jgi:hypothetical protein
MSLGGTLIPAFGVDNIAGATPPIAAFMGGGGDEGLLGKAVRPARRPKAHQPDLGDRAGIFEYN